MIIYLVMQFDRYESDALEGVYSTRELAMEYINKKITETPDYWEFYIIETPLNVEIDEGSYNKKEIYT